MPSQDTVQLHVDAPAERVWALVTDVTRMGEWSSICRRCEWLGGASAPAVGARFVGHNRQAVLFRWSRECVVTACEPEREFGFSTVMRGRPQTHWRYRFEPAGSGTTVVESYQGVWEPLWVRMIKRVPALKRKSERDQRRSMERTLARVKAVAENH